MAGDDPRPTLLQALAARGEAPPGEAIDLGGGTGRDAVPQPHAGWRVLAIDGEAEALEQLDARLDAVLRATDATAGALRGTRPPVAGRPDQRQHVDPVLRRGGVCGVWANIRTALRLGGLIAGHLRGLNDGWAPRGVSVHSRAEVAGLLAGLEVLRCDESEHEGTTASGKAKHWHRFEVVARRPVT